MYVPRSHDKPVDHSYSWQSDIRVIIHRKYFLVCVINEMIVERNVISTDIFHFPNIVVFHETSGLLNVKGLTFEE